MSRKNRATQQAGADLPARPGRWYGGLLAALTALVYARTWSAGFVSYDDPAYITDNWTIQQGLSAHTLRWAFSTGHAANWHPLTWISHIVDFQLFGTWAGGHHLVSVLLHCASVAILYRFLWTTTGSAWRGLVVAGVFALHPLHVESVAWASERKDVLSGLFFMLTLQAYGRHAADPSARRYLAVMAWFALGLMAKPMLVTLPFVLLLLDVWPLKRIDPVPGRAEAPAYRKLLLEKAPLLALSLVSSVVTFLVQRHAGAVSTADEISWGQRVANAAVSYVEYVRKALWPGDLAVIYPYPVDGIPVWKASIAAVLLVAATGFALRRFRKQPWIAVGWFWYLGTLFPVIGIVQVGSQALADRYTYLPLIGLTLAAAWSLPEPSSLGRQARLALQGLAALLLLAMGAACFVQIGYWRDGRTLFSHALDVTRGNFIAYTNLGDCFLEEGQTDLAIEQYEKALAIRPSYPECHANLASAYDRKHDVQRAIFHAREAIRYRPSLASAHYNLGVLLEEQGQVDAAVASYEQAVRLDPSSYDARSNLAAIYTRRGEYAKAVEHCLRALEVYPDFLRARYNLGAAYYGSGSFDAAIAQFDYVLRLEPGHELATSGRQLALQAKQQAR